MRHFHGPEKPGGVKVSAIGAPKLAGWDAEAPRRADSGWEYRSRRHN